MANFADDLAKVAAKARQRERDIFLGVVTECTRSIVEGLALTGAPGQPVDTGNLKASWNISFEDADTALIATNTIYAPAIEHGIGAFGPLTLRSQVGGFHSRALSAAGFSRIVEAVTQRVVGND